jgi:hypothetical protein
MITGSKQSGEIFDKLGGMCASRDDVGIWIQIMCMIADMHDDNGVILKFLIRIPYVPVICSVAPLYR